MRLRAVAPIVIFLLVMPLLAPGKSEVRSDVSAWLKSRADDFQAHLRPSPKRSDHLWRERPSDSLVPGFLPPTSLGPLVRAVRPAVVNVSAVRSAADSGPASGKGQSLGSGFLISAEGFVV